MELLDAYNEHNSSSLDRFIINNTIHLHNML